VLAIVKVIGNVQKYWKGNKLELSLFSSLTSDAMLITPTVHLLNCVKINYLFFVIKLCCVTSYEPEFHYVQSMTTETLWFTETC